MESSQRGESTDIGRQSDEAVTVKPRKKEEELYYKDFTYQKYAPEFFELAKCSYP